MAFIHRAGSALIAVSLLLAGPAVAWGQGTQVAPTEEDAKAAQWLLEGERLVRDKRQPEAIALYFDKTASAYEARFKDPTVKYYSARSMPETLLYLLDAAGGNKGSAVVVSANWAYAYYLKAYALLDLGRLAEAKAQLERALALAPQNAQFLSELGHVYQLEKDWKQSLATFERAESAAQQFSPERARNAELGRAWRGMGYALVELGRLDDAEAILLKCLDLDGNDALAMRELVYVRNAKAKAKAK